MPDIVDSGRLPPGVRIPGFCENFLEYMPHGIINYNGFLYKGRQIDTVLHYACITDLTHIKSDRRRLVGIGTYRDNVVFRLNNTTMSLLVTSTS